MTHYICTGGCHGVADQPGVCGAPACPKHGTPLEACECTDGNHFGKFDQDAAPETLEPLESEGEEK